MEPGALEPELNELPDSGENEVTEPSDIGDYEELSKCDLTRLVVVV